MKVLSSLSSPETPGGRTQARGSSTFLQSMRDDQVRDQNLWVLERPDLTDPAVDSVGLTMPFFHPFWNGHQILMHLVDGAALAAQELVHRPGFGEVLLDGVADLAECGSGPAEPAGRAEQRGHAGDDGGGEKQNVRAIIHAALSL